MTLLLVLLSIATGATGNILIKIGAGRIPHSFGAEAIRSVLANAPLITGILLMAAMFPVYALALQRMSLSVALPLITGGQFILVAIVSHFFLKESLTLANILGILLLIAGMFFVAQR